MRMPAWLRWDALDSDTLAQAERSDPQAALDHSFRLGLKVIAGLLVLLLITGTLVRVRGAVVGEGVVTVQSRVRTISHPTGGVIATMLVREGDRVKKGQRLIQFDTAVSGPSAQASGETLVQLLATQARLDAEQAGRPRILFPPELTRDPSPEAAAAMADAQRLFALRRGGLGQGRAQIVERVRQTEAEIRALTAQRDAARAQIRVIEPELQGLRDLHARGLVTVNRLNAMERTAIELRAQASSIDQQIAQARARIAEIRQSGLLYEQDMRSQAGQQLADVTARISDQTARSAQATDLLDRSAVRAPDDGIVEKLAYTTVGAVIPPAQTIMEIVPENDPLAVEVRISPADIDQLRAGLPTRLRFSAFNAQTTPEVDAVLDRVSAERIVDQQTGISYYKATVRMLPEEQKKLGGLKLVPGMPVEAFIQTGSRSLLSYLTKPIADQFSRAFNEGG